MSKSKKAYAAAGVDVDLGNRVKRGIQTLVKGTHGPEVLGRIGGFGGLFRPNFRGMKDPVLVSSADGVGTKLKLAFMTGRHDTVGQDLVNHCVNDIAVIGARPLFFLDYIGAEKLEPQVFHQLLKGFAKACQAAGCAIVGGETAQMPGMYHPGEYDLVGTIVGVVDRPKLIDGSKIKAGDVIIGLPSSGLHTNGYTLARKILFETLGLKPGAKVAHNRVPGHFGDHARGSDAEAVAIAVDDGGLGQRKRKDRKTVDQCVVRLCVQGGDRCAHRFMSGAEDVDLIDLDSAGEIIEEALRQFFRCCTHCP